MSMRPALAPLLIAAGALCACAGGPNGFQPPPPTHAVKALGGGDDCPIDVAHITAGQLYGSWSVALLPGAARGTLTLTPHPEYSASLRGHFDYEGVRSIASGDVEAGELNLDESRDGKTLFAFWSGRLVPAACGAEIRGRWQPVPRDGQPTPAERDFVLRRTGVN